MPAKAENFPLCQFNHDACAELEKCQSPAQFYETLWRKGIIANSRSAFYILGPLNHFGAARLIPENPEKAFAANVNIHTFIADLIAEDHPDIQLALPHHLGSRPGWGRFHYNFFWLCFLSGIKPEMALSIYEKAKQELNIKLINDKSNLTEEGRAEYKKMLELFEREWTAEERAQTLHPVKGAIALFDSNMSTDTQLQKKAAQFLGIPIYTIIVNTGANGSTLWERMQTNQIPQILELQRNGYPVSPLLRISDLKPISSKRVLLVDEKEPFVILTENGPIALIEEFSPHTMTFETFEGKIEPTEVLRKKLHNAENAALLISGIIKRYLRGDSGSGGYGPEKMMLLSNKTREFSLFRNWITYLQKKSYLPRTDYQLGLIDEESIPAGNKFIYPPLPEISGNISKWRIIEGSNGQELNNLDQTPTVVIFGSAIEGDTAAQIIGKFIGKKRGVCIVGGDGRNTTNAMSQITAETRKHGGYSSAVTTEYLLQHQPPDTKNHLLSVVTDNMATRKGIYYPSGDVFIALKGGIGTTEEIISTIIFNLKAKLEGRKPKPMILINSSNHWNVFLRWIDRLGLTDEIIVLKEESEIEETLAKIIG